jgi:7-carboxy-7-deazaguanine synthase
MFSSIQGEGILTGVPSTFVRVSGCNLRCVWCDTPYASWNPEGDTREVAEVAQQIKSLPNRHVVLTGGEPMLFDPIEALCAELHESGFHITIETAGTVFRRLPCDLMSISPKLKNSAPPADSGWLERHESTRSQPEVLSDLTSNYDYQLKFVIGDTPEADLREIDEILAGVPGLLQDRVLLMPEGIDAEVLRRRQKTLVDLCIQRGWRLCSRLHIELFGNRRGT